MDKPVLIIGHQHPDTDSVCSAIAYAYLKKQQGWNAEPARAPWACRLRCGKQASCLWKIPG